MRRVWGDGKKCKKFRRPKFSFLRQKFLMTFFNKVYRIFPFFSHIFRIFTMLNVVYDPFFTRKSAISENNSLTTPFFTLFVLSRASDNTTSPNIGETDAWAVPTSNFGGTVPQSPPRSPPLIDCHSGVLVGGVCNVLPLSLSFRGTNGEDEQ